MSHPTVDIAVLTAKAEEYRAFYNRLKAPVQWQAPAGGTNQYAWALGTLPKTGSDRTYRIVLALTYQQTNVPASIAALATFEVFRPRYLIFMGIAGSLDASVRKGDVLIPDYVRQYEYGSVSDQGVFEPRMQFQEAMDQALLRSAVVFDSLNEWWAEAGDRPGDSGGPPRLQNGALASGDKVIESTDNPFFAPVLKSDSWLRAVDMESAGVALAVQALRERGEVAGMMVVRGISDVPKNVAGDTPNRETRKRWTEYASNVAALFLERFIAGGFPTPPRKEESAASRHQFDPFVFTSYSSHFARAEELPTIHALNGELFKPEDLVPAPTLEAWWRRNPMTIRLVRDPKGEAIGYWNILPFTPAAFEKMSLGKLREREIGDAEIVTYGSLQPGSVYLYVTALGALPKFPAAPVVLDMIAFFQFVAELVGVDGIAAMNVSDDPLNLMANFGMAPVDNTNPPVWLLRSKADVQRALEAGRIRLNDLKGFVPETSPGDEQSFRNLLDRRN